MRALREDMRDRVLDAAGLFAEHGVDATTMDAIAEATGIPRATLYYYFSSKEEILAYVFGEILGAVREAVLAAVTGGGTAAERLADVVRAHLDVYVRYPMPSRALQLDLGRAARTSEIAEAVDAAFIAPVVSLLKQGVADGTLRTTGSTRLTAYAILGAITTTGVNALTLEPRSSVSAVAAEVTSLVLEGIGT